MADARHVLSGWLPAVRARRERFVLAGLILGLAYYYVVPSPLLALPGLLLFVLLTWRRLDLALCLLPLTFPFWYVPKRVTGSVVFPLSEVALAVCVAVALARLLLRPRASLKALRLRLRRRVRASVGRAGPDVLLGAVLLLLGLTLGVLVARRPHEALRAYRWVIVEPLVYFVLVVAYARGPRAAMRLVWSFVGSAVVLAALATLQVTALHVTFAPIAEGNRLLPYDIGGGVPRATAFIYGSGNNLGAWLERALPLALALAVVPRGLARGERILAGAAFLACLPALLWSDSRGAEVGATLACLAVLCVAYRHVVACRSWLPLVLGGAGVALALAIALAMWQHDRLVALFLTAHGGTGTVRSLVWLSAWHMLRDHPLLGIGPDQFVYYYSPHYTSHPYWIPVLNGHATLAAREPDLAHPHNLLLDLWLSGGLVAVAGFVVLLGALGRRCLVLFRANAAGQAGGGRGVHYTVALGVAGSLLAGLIHGAVDNAYFLPDLALAFWWAVATLAVLLPATRLQGAGKRRPATRGTRRA
jgi:O-antigen ligase